MFLTVRLPLCLLCHFSVSAATMCGDDDDASFAARLHTADHSSHYVLYDGSCGHPNGVYNEGHQWTAAVLYCCSVDVVDGADAGK